MKNLILLHGALGHIDQFNSLKKDLEKEFQIHLLLFKGHGHEYATTQSFFVEDLVVQLNEFIQENKIEKPVVFGYSLGGYIALCHHLSFPGIIQSILTLATKMEWSPEIAKKEMQLLNPDVILEKVPKFAVQLQKVHGENWKQLLKQIAGLMEDIGHKKYLNETTFSKIYIPVQIMVGDRDKQVSLKESKWAFDHLSDSTLAVLPNTGHPFEKADNETIKLFIRNFLKDKK